MQARQEPAVFRGRADAVVVSVAVRDKTKPVTGLAAADFQLVDNGVTQAITSVSAEAAPVDVTLLLDTSSSLEGSAFAKLKEDIRDMAAMLKVDDRLRLVTFASRVVDVIGLQPGTATLPLERLTAGGVTSLYNGLATALMIAPDTDRAQLAFGVTDGYGSASFIPPGRLVRLAEYSSATLYIAIVPPPLRSNIDALRAARVNAAGTGYAYGFVTVPQRARWNVPHREALQATVRAAGGVLYDAQRDDSLPRLFRAVLQDFRTSYVLRYTPGGVLTPGWHEIVVTVPKRPNLVVRARRGYERN